MKKILTGLAFAAAFFILLILFTASAQAGEAVLTWTHPTQNEDNSALPIGQITRTEVEYGVCNAGKTGFLATPAPVIVSVLPPPATTTVVGLAPNTWCFRARTVANGQSSVWTGMVSKVVIPPAPKPPTTLTVAADLTAYIVVKRPDKFVMVAVGVVAPGTECITSQTVNGYYVVPRASVTVTGTVKPDLVVALCS